MHTCSSSNRHHCNMQHVNSNSPLQRQRTEQADPRQGQRRHDKTLQAQKPAPGDRRRRNPARYLLDEVLGALLHLKPGPRSGQTGQRMAHQAAARSSPPAHIPPQPGRAGTAIRKQASAPWKSTDEPARRLMLASRSCNKHRPLMVIQCSPKVPIAPLHSTGTIPQVLPDRRDPRARAQILQAQPGALPGEYRTNPTTPTPHNIKKGGSPE